MTNHAARSNAARMAADAPTATLDVGGNRFAYRDFGPRTGVPLVFLHHFTATIDDWDPRVLDGIASQRRVITFDNRGVGGSGGRTPTSVTAMAEDAIAVIMSLGLKEVDLMGFSLGGFVAQVILAKEPDRVRKVILAGTGPAGGDGVGNFSRRLVSDMLQGLITRRDPKRYLFFTRTANGKAMADAYLQRLQERTSDRVPASSPRAIAAQLLAIRRWGRQHPMDLSAVTHPVLVANGEDDRMVPTRASFDMAHRLPNATLRVYPDSGHGGVFQYHDHFVRQMLDFLA